MLENGQDPNTKLPVVVTGEKPNKKQIEARIDLSLPMPN